MPFSFDLIEPVGDRQLEGNPSVFDEPRHFPAGHCGDGQGFSHFDGIYLLLSQLVW